MPPPLAGKIALVTGASRGIGYATALALARAGAHVVAVARTVGGLEELDDAIRAVGGSATLVPLDLKDYDGIARLGAALNERYRRLDILVGNAGMLGPLSPLGHVEPKAWDEVIAVNVTANWHLIRAMDPLLRLSEAGRVVFVTSGVGTQPARLLGTLRGLQGGARRAGAHLCGGDRHDQCARQPVQPGPDPHAHARRRDAGRGPDDAQDRRGGRREDRRALPAGRFRRPARSTTIAQGPAARPRSRRRSSGIVRPLSPDRSASRKARSAMNPGYRFAHPGTSELSPAQERQHASIKRRSSSEEIELLGEVRYILAVGHTCRAGA